jgi:hypothetical protein
VLSENEAGLRIGEDATVFPGGFDPFLRYNFEISESVAVIHAVGGAAGPDPLGSNR